MNNTFLWTKNEKMLLPKWKILPKRFSKNKTCMLYITYFYNEKRWKSKLMYYSNTFNLNEIKTTTELSTDDCYKKYLFNLNFN